MPRDPMRRSVMRWDRMYLEAVRKEGITMWLHERNVDDSNQIAESRHEDDKTLAEDLTKIANGIMDGIRMEKTSHYLCSDWLTLKYNNQ